LFHHGFGFFVGRLDHDNGWFDGVGPLGQPAQFSLVTFAVELLSLIERDVFGVGKWMRCHG
jgi:hypothetical protein